MAPIRVVTVDDEPLIRERIRDLVQGTDGLELVGEGANGLEALDLIMRLSPDLVFIDVEMPELSGFGVIAALDPASIPGVVFITAYEHYALSAFDAGAIDYLHKPVTKQRFALAVERATERLARRSPAEVRALVTGATTAERTRGYMPRFVVNRASTHYFVPVEQVDWIDVADNYLQLHVGGRTHLWRGTMKQAVEGLDPAHFARIHRSAMVAVDRIASLKRQAAGGWVVELLDGSRLRSSRQYADEVRRLLRNSS
jgi:two-component system, LytTR family, response regulator